MCLLHDKTSIFHLSGSDYMGQEKIGDYKRKRLIDDVINIDHKSNVPRKSILIITLGMLILYYLKFSIEKSTYISNTFTLLLFGTVLYSIKK